MRQNTTVNGTLGGVIEPTYQDAEASSDDDPHPLDQELVARRGSGEYDPSIWDFLTPATGDDDEEEDEEEEEEEDDDDDDDDSGARITARSPREVDVRSTKHAQAVLEIVETEISYGNDLAIIKRVCISNL